MDEDFLTSIHHIELNFQEIKDKFSFLEEKVDNLTITITSLKDRIKDLEVYVTKKNALHSFLSNWWRLPAAAALAAAVFEALKNKFHF